MSIKNIVEAAKISGAGVLFVYGGKILLIYRSGEVVDPNCWCGAGGKIEPGETPEEAARRESVEEIGFPADHECDMLPLYVYNSDNLVFHNYIGVLTRDPFRPTLNWESDGYGWFEWGEWPAADQLHYGFNAILKDKEAGPLLERAVRRSEK